MKTLLRVSLVAAALYVAAGQVLFSNADEGQQQVAVVRVDQTNVTFPCTLAFDGEYTEKSRKFVLYGSKKKDNTKTFSISPGKHTCEVFHTSRLTSYGAAYTLKRKGKVLWRSQQLVLASRQVNLEAGDTLEVKISEPLQKDNQIFFTFRGVNCGLALWKPHWYYRGNHGLDHSNCMAFFADEAKWGPKRVFENLTTQISKEIPRRGWAKGDCLVYFMLELPDKRVPDAFAVPFQKKSQMAKFKADLHKTFLQQYELMLRHHSITYPPDRVASLIQQGHLPKLSDAQRKLLRPGVVAPRLHISYSRALEYAREALRKKASVTAAK